MANSPPAGPDRVTWSTLFAYGVPGAAFSFYLFFVQFYFLKFATDVLLAAPAVMGALFGLGRIWDAISDPLVGAWSDRTRTRLGRRRPWMIAGIPLLFAFSAMVWSPPESLGSAGLVVWSAVALLGFYASYTVYTIPHASLGAEISLAHHERTRVFGAYRMFFVAGMLLAFVAIDRVSNAETPRDAVRVVSLTAGVVASLALLLAPGLLRERPGFVARSGRASPWQAARGVLANPHARILLFAWFVEALGNGVLGVLAPFVTEYVLQRPDLIGVVPAFYVIAGVAAIPVWILLSHRFGKRNIWMAATLLGALSFGATAFVGPGDVALLCVLLVFAGIGGGAGGAIGASMLADVIDWDEHRTGERKEGAYSAAWGFALKLAIGLMIAVSGLALQLSGFQPNVEQTATAEWTLRGMFAGGPLVGGVVAVLMLSRFTLDEKEHARVRAELDARSAASPGAS